MGKILAIYTAIKEGIKIFNALKDLYDKWQDRQIDSHYEKKKKRRERIVKLIQLESAKDNPSDTVLRDLHRKLNNIDSNFM